MGSSAVHMVCVTLGVIGLFGVVVCCALPRWKVSALIGNNFFIAKWESQEGLWMECTKWTTGQHHCNVYHSIVPPSDVHVARPMTIISCILCGLSLLLLFFGADFTICVQNKDTKTKLIREAWMGLLLAGLLVIIPVSWSAYKTVKDFHSQMISRSMKREIGVCIYIGWAAGVMLVLAGGLLWYCSRPKPENSEKTASYYWRRALRINKNYMPNIRDNKGNDLVKTGTTTEIVNQTQLTITVSDCNSHDFNC